MRVGWGVLQEATLGLVVVNLLFCIWLLRILSLRLDQTMAELDTRLAQTIQTLVKDGIGNFEPVNPIQAAIAQALTQNLSRTGSTPADVVEMARDNSGKFS